MPCEARCSPGNLVLAERLSSRSRPRVKTCGADVRRRRRRPLHRSSVVMAAVSESCCRDLLVVGPGVLGSLVCQRWLKVRALASSRRSRVRRARSTTDLDPRRFFSIVSQQNASEFVSLSLTRRSNGHAQTFPAATVIGQTNTDASHERLVALGISPRLKADAGESRRFPFVVFSAPPSGSDDYTAEVEAALKLWDGTGGFVFTSSTAVYAGKDGEDCDESGCTACVNIITEDFISCANLGDTRAVLCRNGEVLEMSHDHKPTNPEETKRIEKAGARVTRKRVNAAIAVSRR